MNQNQQNLQQKKKALLRVYQMYQYRSTKCNVVKQNKVRLKNKKKASNLHGFQEFNKEISSQCQNSAANTHQEKKKGAAFLNSSTFVPKIVVRMRNGKLEDQMQKGVRDRETNPRKWQKVKLVKDVREGGEGPTSKNPNKHREERERERENEKWEKVGERESVVGGMYVHATPSPQITVWERRWRVGNSQEM